MLRVRYGGKQGNMAKKEWWILPELNHQPTDNEADALLNELSRCEATTRKSFNAI